MKYAIQSNQAFIVLLIFIAGVMFMPGLVYAGNLEPSAPPAPTMKTLDEVTPAWSRVLPYNDGDSNGCNSSRFTCILEDRAVLDNETGLVWEKTPLTVADTWFGARTSCLGRGLILSTGIARGWRLPSIIELTSLGNLLSNHPFNIQGAAYYWSLSTNASDDTQAWAGYIGGTTSGTGSFFKTDATSASIWCVRGGYPGPTEY